MWQGLCSRRSFPGFIKNPKLERASASDWNVGFGSRLAPGRCPHLPQRPRCLCHLKALETPARRVGNLAAVWTSA